MHWPAVEDLIALGAKVDVTLSQQHMTEWTNEDVSSKFTQRGAKIFWEMKMDNFWNLRGYL